MHLDEVQVRLFAAPALTKKCMQNTIDPRLHELPMLWKGHVRARLRDKLQGLEGAGKRTKRLLSSTLFLERWVFFQIL
jgi:hypothetical protein